MKHPHRIIRSLFLAFTLAGALGATDAVGAVAVGATGPNFTMRNHKTLQNFQLYSHQGSIVLLDFWAYWCGPCMNAAQDMEPNIVQFYRNNGGNANGIPVTVISVSVDMSDLAAANNFINTYGLELVADDIYNGFGSYGSGSIPHFVVLNGTTNSTNYKTWEVRYSTAGYSRTAIKAAIDAIQTPAPICTLTGPAAGAQTSPTNTVLTANLVTKGKIIKKVEFYNGASLLATDTNAPYAWTWTNAPIGAKTVTAKAYYGTSSSVTSPAVAFTVAPPPIQATLSCQGQNLAFCWTGGPGTYQVQVATNLLNPDWQNLGSPTTGASITLPQTNGAAFYRIKRL